MSPPKRTRTPVGGSRNSAQAQKQALRPGLQVVVRNSQTQDRAIERALDARLRLQGVRAVVLDVDGSLTDGTLFVGAQGELMKGFHAHDGMGISLLRQAGIEVAVLTARTSEIVRVRAQELGISHVMQGCRDKAAGLVELSTRLGCEPKEIAYFGDDWGDLPAMRIAGLAAAPASAHAEVRCRVHWVSKSAAGRGAVREFADWLLHSMGLYDSLLERYLSGSAQGSVQ